MSHDREPVLERRPAVNLAQLRMRARPAPTALALLSAVALAAAGPVVAAQEAEPGWVVERVRFEPVADGGGHIRVDGSPTYRGTVEVRSGPAGLAVISEVSLNDYVKGIVEMPADWPAEALEAQAVAARTYALNQRASTADSTWRAAGADICATQQCQVYGGVDGERRPSGDRWVAAADATAGQVLLSRGEPILALYSSSNGGRSTAGGKPYLKAINDPDDARSPLSRWSNAVPLGSVAGMLGVAPPLTLVGVSSQEGAVVYTVKDPAGVASSRSIGADDFRGRANSSLGAAPGLPSAVPSPRFSVATSGDRAVISGGGWGHGMGMSQYGAYGKALQGMSSDAILAAYYGGITPTTLGGDQLPASIRVAVALGQSGVTVSAERYFRPVSESGIPLGGVEVGRWKVKPAKGGVRVIPPVGRDQPLTARTASVEPPGPESTPVVRFDLTAPAVVTVRYVTPTGQPGAGPAEVVDVGEVIRPLPPPLTRGSYRVVIEADGGPGRFLSVPLHLEVDGPVRVRGQTVGAGEPVASRGGRAPVAALALLLVVVMGAALAASRNAARP